MCPAIHINSRSWLRSSSTREPSDPPLRVFISNKFLPRARGNEPSRGRRDESPDENRTKQCKKRNRKTRVGAASELFEPRGRRAQQAARRVCSPPVRDPTSRARYPDLRKASSKKFCAERDAAVPATKPCHRVSCKLVGLVDGNDPSAGSPTETLLRLLLPLDDQV